MCDKLQKCLEVITNLCFECQKILQLIFALLEKK